MTRDDLKIGREALARADWAGARKAFEAARGRAETAEALEGLGMAAWWLDDARTVFEARERAFKLYRRAGDRRGAGRVALALAEDHLYFRGGPAVASGWYRRARRLLEGLDPCPEHGWLKLGEGQLALDAERDPVASRERAAEAAALARRLGLVDLEMMALALEGLSFVCAGRLRDGMPRLDEAVTAAVSGELEDPYAIGYAYCCLVQACERVRDYERAAQWCERSRQYGNEIRFGLLSAICRTQYASVLIWRGAWREAEAELDAAIRQLRAIRPPLEGEGTVRLARLRRLQGRLDEAEALLGASESHPHALAEQAALALDRGDAAAASRLGERFLRQTNPADVTERVQGHEVLLRARLGQGDRAAAQAAVDELRAIAQALDTNPLRASVRLGEGLLAAASGAHHDARRAFEDAADLYRRSGAPLETARARLELAGVLRALGQTEAARAEVRAAREAFAALGAARDARRAEALGGELERPARGPGGRDPRSHLTPREVEVLRLVAEGLSNAQIAARLHVSEFTVKRHVANILSTLELPTRAAAAAYTVRNQLA